MITTMKRILITAPLLLVSVNTHAIDPSIKIEADLLSNYCSEYFGPATFRFTNKSDQWKTLKNVSINFQNEAVDRNISIVTGPALGIWYRSISAKVAYDNMVNQLILGTIAVIGLAATGARDTSTATAGAALALGSTGMLAVHGIDTVRTQIKTAGVVPDNHLLYDDIVVPPGLFADRWILLNTQDGGSVPYITHTELVFTTDSGEIDKRKLRLRSDFDNSCSWQSRLRPKDDQRD